MVHESLADEFRRIGLLPGVALALAAALATFALLDQLMPISAKTGPPRVLAPSTAKLSPAQAVVGGAGVSGKAVAGGSRESNAIAAQQRASVKQARADARRVNRIMAAKSRVPTLTVPPHAKVPTRVAPAGTAPPSGSATTTTTTTVTAVWSTGKQPKYP